MREESKNKLFISNRDRGLSVAIFKREEVNLKGDGQLHTTYSANIQRSWQKPEDKGTDNWQRQSVSLFPDELLKMAALCVRTYNELSLSLQKERDERRERPAANYPSQSYDAPEPPAYFDDVPMDF